MSETERIETAAARHDRILILDFGSQYTQLIARRLRETHVYCEIHPYDVGDDFVRAFAPKGIVLSGSHAQRLRRRRRAARAGSGVDAGRAGARHLLRHADDGAPARRAASSLATCASSVMRRCARAGTRRCSAASQDRAQRGRARPARRLDEPRRQGHRAAAGLQADRLVRRVRDRRRWPTNRAASTPCSSIRRSRTRRRAPPSSRASRTTSAAAATTGTCTTTSARRSRRSASSVGREHVILGLSGGVDSSVAAALIHQAIGDQLTCVFVDHGLLR